MQERVLVVEDRIDNASNAQLALTNAGCAVDVAFDLEQAIFLMDRASYSGIITDMTFQEQGVNSSETIFNSKTSFNGPLLPFLRAEQLPQEHSEHIRQVLNRHDGILNREGRLTSKTLEKICNDWYNNISTRKVPSQKSDKRLIEALTSVDLVWRAELKAKHGENWLDWSKPHWQATINEFVLYRQKKGSIRSAIKELSKELAASVCLDEEPTYRALGQFQSNPQLPIGFEVQERYVDALKKSALIIEPKEQDEPYLSLELVGYTSTARRKEVAKKSSENYSADVHREQCRLEIVDSNDFLTEKENISRYNSLDTGLIREASNPALGYFVVERAMQGKTPVISITNARHAAHAIPALNASGVLSLAELQSKKRNDDFLEFARAIVTFTYEKTVEIYSRGLELLRKAK